MTLYKFNPPRDVFSVKISEDKSNIVIHFEDPRYSSEANMALLIIAHGGCCSQSWFESVPEDLESIQDIEAITFNDDPFSTKEVEDGKVKLYVMNIFDTLGNVFRFELRNDSNGFYSGDIKICLVGEALEPSYDADDNSKFVEKGSE